MYSLLTFEQVNSFVIFSLSEFVDFFLEFLFADFRLGSDFSGFFRCSRLKLKVHDDIK